MTLFGKSLKSGKIWTNFEQYFLLRKKWKILEKSLVKSVKKMTLEKFVEKWKNFKQW